MINFVIGPPCAGKSTFIKSTFPNATIIDLWDFQKNTVCNIVTILESYEKVKEALINAIKSDDSLIVLEHTLLRAERRVPYIEAIKEISNEPINCYVLKPTQKEYLKRCKARNVHGSIEDFKMLEIPTKDEDFDKIYIIK